MTKDRKTLRQFPMCPAVAYEMLVSHSPPLFSHSPPTGGFLSDYSSFRISTSDTFPRVSRGICRAMPPTTLSFTAPTRNPLASPKRPCLVIRADESPGEEEPTSPTRLKKKVVFADDKGMSLTHVRVMTEPSNVPPLWSVRYLSEVTQGVTAEPEADAEPWEVAFPQPASDYVDFRKRLEHDKVSLENVIVKEADEIVLGTVKVSNMSFHKEVFVRISSDCWKTHEDAFCNYVPNSMASTVSPAYVLFDTFSFKITLPPKGRRIEFCVCFRCDGNEFWDNNGGKNYILMKKEPAGPMHKSFSADDLFMRHMQQAASKPRLIPKCTDVTRAKLDSWSEFASWNHLETSTPYW